MNDESISPPEQRARVLTDRQLTDAGWAVKDRKGMSLFAGQGVVVREVVMARGHGRGDYLIYVDQSEVGVIEAKPAGTDAFRISFPTDNRWRTFQPDFISIEKRRPMV